MFIIYYLEAESVETVDTRGIEQPEESFKIDRECVLKNHWVDFRRALCEFPNLKEWWVSELAMKECRYAREEIPMYSK